ncbi:MAG: hypothetical protein MJ105_03440 [Lachnospiraceae bacterium]|nr:hypothetical protein [Lachnospiraceae bacterium]
MEEFAIRLNNVPNSYYGFVSAVLSYVKKNQTRFDVVSKYMNENPTSNSSDILWFISQQPDFFEDSVSYSSE